LAHGPYGGIGGIGGVGGIGAMRDGIECQMRVAHLTTVDSTLWYLLRPQLLAVLEAGGEVYGISAPGPYVARLEGEGVRHIALPSSTRGWSLASDVRAAVELWRVLRRERFDVLHTHNPKPGVYGRILGRLARVPIVVNTNHGLYFGGGQPVQRAVVLGLEAVAARFSDAELIQNPEDLELLVRRRLNPPRRSRLLGNGVDLARFRPGPAAERAAVRAELGVDDDQIVVGMVGRMVAEKGYPELFEAAARLPDRYVVVCIGPDDPDKADALPGGAIDAARKAGLRLLGLRDDVDRLYRGMDLFVLPSHREGFPRAAMEAAATGLPVIATDIRGCRQVVDHGVTGLLVPVRSPEALAGAIGDLGEDAERRAAMGEAAIARARRHFDERRVVERVIDTYEVVARAKRLATGPGLRRRVRDSGHG
jgi:glycosyltransferase involved in cell wall biosynthesis